VKCLGGTTAHPQSWMPPNLTRRDRRALNAIAHKNCLSSLSIVFQTAFGSNISTITVCRELNEMNIYGWAATHSLRSPCAMASVGWSGIKLATIRLLSSGNTFSGVMNHASQSRNPSD
jgi:hypothetical protein